jgi:hypothetical protein
MEYHFQVEVDNGLVAKATDELFVCLLARNLAFIDRWYSSVLTGRIKSITRLVALGLCTLGILLCLVVISFCPAWVTVSPKVVGYISAFIAFGLVFYYLPTIDRKARRWTERNAVRQCKRRARRATARVKRLLPVTVEYYFKGDVLICNRRKNNTRVKAWTRRIKGIACQGETITVIFKTSKSIYPIAMLLHRDNTVLNDALKALSIKIKPIAGSAGSGNTLL